MEEVSFPLSFVINEVMVVTLSKLWVFLLITHQTFCVIVCYLVFDFFFILHKTFVLEVILG